jgi:hypothetical protein
MANPYHDAEGKFCSANEMKTAYENLGKKGDLEGYFKLRQEYEEIKKDLSSFEKEVTVSQEKKSGKTTAKKRPDREPVVVEKNPLFLPRRNAELSDYFDNGESFDYDYSSYHAPEGMDDEYGRNRVYNDLHVSAVPSTRNALSSIFSCKPEEVPDELVEYGNKLGVDDVHAYETSTTPDYYGENAHIHVDHGIQRALETWYFEHNDNARDSSGILDYVRNKGQETKGLTVLESVKAQLAYENNGKVPVAVAGANYVSVADIGKDSITIPNGTKFDKVDAVEPPVKPKGRLAKGVENPEDSYIAGVVGVDKNGKYVLIDGYRRVKGISAPRKKYRYLVLSNRPPGRLSFYDTVENYYQ